jgi:SAM-dependent methyltransferase
MLMPVEDGVAAAVRRELDRLLPAGWVWNGKRVLDFGSRAAHAPGLPLDGGSLDLVWATSVFAHLTDHWSGWLHELHRLLAPGGLLIAACLGDGLRQSIEDAPWAFARAGLTVCANDEAFDAGGPKLLASPWWTCARWRRAFDIVRVEPSGFMGGHGVVVARKPPVAATVADLEREPARTTARFES